MSDERFQRGEAIIQEVYGDVGAKSLSVLDGISPELRRMVSEFAFGDVISRPALDLRSRELVTIAALTTLGTAPSQLRAHVYGALNVGCTKPEVVEVVLQMAVYAGFPAAINGMAIVREAFALWDNREQ